MKSFSRVVLLLLAAGVSNALQAAALDIQLNDETARVILSAPAGLRGMGDANQEYGFGYNTEDDYIIHGGLLVHGSRRGSPLQGGAGVRLYAGDIAEETIVTIALGGFLRLGLADEGRFAVSVNGFYAPEITSFGDAEDMFEAQLRAEYQALPTIVVFAGAQVFDVDLDKGGDAEFAEGLFLGMRLGF